MKKIIFALSILASFQASALPPFPKHYYWCYVRETVYWSDQQTVANIFALNPQPGYGEFVNGYWRWNTGTIYDTTVGATLTCSDRALAQAKASDKWYASVGLPQLTVRGFSLLVERYMAP